MAKRDVIEVKLLRLRETKTTVVYEAGDGAPLRNLYLNKGALSPMPDAVRLVVEAVRPASEEETA